MGEKEKPKLGSRSSKVSQKIAAEAKRHLEKVSISNIYHCLKGKISKSKIKNRKNIFVCFLNSKIDLSTRKTKDIEQAVKYCKHLAKSGLATPEEKEQIRTLFQKMAVLDEKKFDRKKLLAGEKELQRILSPELDQLYRIQESIPEEKIDNSLKLKINVARAQLAVSLGFGIELTPNGVNGAVFIRSLEGPKIGVFKAPKQTGWLDLTAMAKSHFGQMRLLNKSDALAQEFAEVAAYQLSSRMGFNIAPEATMAEIKGKQGAFIAFLDGYDLMSNHVETFNKRTEFSEREKSMWQMLSIFNFLAGNQDPHGENIFAKFDEKGHLVEARMIDFGNAFNEHNPGKWGSIGNQGAWGKYTIAQKEFTKETKGFIQKELTDEKFEEFLEYLRKERSTFMTPKMVELMKDRLTILRECVATGIIKSPKQLSEIHYNEDFDRYFKEMRATPKFECDKVIGEFVIIDVK
jgi:hypothetical protein